MKLIYSKNQVKKAAKYIWKKNPAAPRFAQSEVLLANQIERELIKYAHEVFVKLRKDKDWRILATGGYWIIIMLDSDDILQAHVLVEPDIKSGIGDSDIIDLES